MGHPGVTRELAPTSRAHCNARVRQKYPGLAPASQGGWLPRHRRIQVEPGDASHHCLHWRCPAFPILACHLSITPLLALARVPDNRCSHSCNPAPRSPDASPSSCRNPIGASILDTSSRSLQMVLAMVVMVLVIPRIRRAQLQQRHL